MVDLAARRTREAARASAEAPTLSTVAGSVLRGDRPLPALLERLRETFGLDAVTLLERRPDAPAARTGSTTRTPGGSPPAVGGQPCATPAEGDADVPVDDDLTLVLRGQPLAAADRRVVEAFAAQAAVALRQERLAEQAATRRPARRGRPDAHRAARRGQPRPAHPAGLRQGRRGQPAQPRTSTFADDDRDELLATADESLDRLDRLVENLLDMSRLQAGALGVTAHRDRRWRTPSPRPSTTSATRPRRVTVRIPDDLPAVHADPGLLRTRPGQPARQRPAVQPARPAAA